MHKILSTKLFLTVSLTLVLLLMVFLGREINRTLQVRQEINRLEQQAHRLERQNQQLRSLIEYLDSEDYHERAARERLNLQLPGEIAVALPDQAANTQVLESQAEAELLSESNLRSWWVYFFGIQHF